MPAERVRGLAFHSLVSLAALACAQPPEPSPPDACEQDPCAVECGPLPERSMCQHPRSEVASDAEPEHAGTPECLLHPAEDRCLDASSIE
jgi:hypothetical protein